MKKIIQQTLEILNISEKKQLRTIFFFTIIGIPKYLKIFSVWSLDFFALITVRPGEFKAANITVLLHCADPLLSV